MKNWDFDQTTQAPLYWNQGVNTSSVLSGVSAMPYEHVYYVYYVYFLCGDSVPMGPGQELELELELETDLELKYCLGMEIFHSE